MCLDMCVDLEVSLVCMLCWETFEQRFEIPFVLFPLISQLTNAFSPSSPQGDLINFFKFRKVAEIIVEIKSYQFRYHLEISPDISQFLTNLTTMTEDEWHTWSQKVVYYHFRELPSNQIFLFEIPKVEPKVPEKAISELIQKETDLDCRLCELKKREDELMSRLLSLSGTLFHIDFLSSFQFPLYLFLRFVFSFSLSLSYLPKPHTLIQTHISLLLPAQGTTRDQLTREMCAALGLTYNPPAAPSSSSVAAKKSSTTSSIPIVVDPVVDSNSEYMSLWKFEPDFEEEIALSAGETVEMVSGEDDDWCLVKNVLGKQGYVPRNYIRPMESEVVEGSKLGRSMPLSTSSISSSSTSLSGSSSLLPAPVSSSSASPSPQRGAKLPNMLHRTASALAKQVGEMEKGRDSPSVLIKGGGGESVTSTPRNSSKPTLPWTAGTSAGSQKREASPPSSRPSPSMAPSNSNGSGADTSASGSKLNKFFGEDATAASGKEKEKKKGLFGLKKEKDKK